MARRVKKQEVADDPDLSLVREQFEEYADATIGARALAEKCRNYRDGKQWTDDEIATLKKRKQPCITDNKIQDKCDTLLGIEKQKRTDPRAYPRTPHENEAAEAATDALRYVADSSDYHRAVRKEAADNLMVEGLCGGQVIVEKRNKGVVKVCMEHIRWDRLYYDPYSLRADFDDKRYCGYFTWMDYEDAEQQFPERKDKLDASFAGESLSGPDSTHDDKPRYVLRSGGRKRVQVFKHYVRKGGVWNEGIWCKGGWLEDLKPCAYKDDDGKPQCCIELQALYRDSDGNPYGVVPRYLDLQDEHNKRRSKMLHLLNAKRVIVQKGALDDLNLVRSEIHKPDGVVEVAGNVDQIRVEDNLAEAQGQWQMLQQTDLSLAATGPNAALAGQSGAISGRAKQLDQASGTLPVSPLFEALESWELRMYRQAWCRVRQYWNEETWIRVTDDEKKMKFVALNQKLTHGDMLAEEVKRRGLPPDQAAQLVQQIAQDPMAQEPAIDETGRPRIKNEVARMDVDIIIDRSPDTVTIQQEQFDILARIGEKRPEIPFDVIVEASQLRSEIKNKVLDRLKGTNDPAAAKRAQFEEMMQQLAAALADAKVRRENAAAAKDEAATVESQVDASVKVATFTNGPDQPAAGTSKQSVAVN